MSATPAPPMSSGSPPVNAKCVGPRRVAREGTDNDGRLPLGRREPTFRCLLGDRGLGVVVAGVVTVDAGVVGVVDV